MSVPPPAANADDDARTAATDMLAPLRYAARPGARPRPQPVAEISFGGEVSSPYLCLAPVAVGTPIAGRSPHRSRYVQLSRIRFPTSGPNGKCLPEPSQRLCPSRWPRSLRRPGCVLCWPAFPSASTLTAPTGSAADRSALVRRLHSYYGGARLSSWPCYHSCLPLLVFPTRDRRRQQVNVQTTKISPSSGRTPLCT